MRERLETIRQAWQIARARNPRLPWLVFGPIVVLAVVGIVLTLVLGDVWWGPLLLLVGLVIGTMVFGRQAQAAQYATIEGRPGAAAAVLEAARGQWFVRPAVAFTKKQDLVHRAVGRCGVVLVAEGKATRLRPVLAKATRHSTPWWSATVRARSASTGCS